MTLVRFCQLVLASGILLAGSAAVAQDAGGPTPSGKSPDGEAIFGARCKFCHDPSAFGAPPRETLATYDHARVFDALSTGKMAQNAAGLNVDEMHAVAAYVTGKPSAPSAAGTSGPTSANQTAP